MSNRTAATLLVAVSVVLGWFWRIAVERDWPVAFFGYIAFFLLVSLLWNRLDDEEDRS